jgi:protein-disulfide isomerase
MVPGTFDPSQRKKRGQTPDLDADMAKPELQMVVDRNRALARDVGISGTPRFIVGTELVPGALDLKGLKDLIARARGSQ